MNPLGPLFGNLRNDCCELVRYVYVPNCPDWLNGRRFSSDRELALIANINVRDYQSELKCGERINDE
jgi:hypothetical protein